MRPARSRRRRNTASAGWWACRRLKRRLAATRANHQVLRAKGRSLPVHAAAVCLPENDPHPGIWPDGKPTGEYDATYDAVRSGDGKLYEKAIAAPESTLQYLQFEPEDAQYLTRIPPYPVTLGQMANTTCST